MLEQTGSQAVGAWFRANAPEMQTSAVVRGEVASAVAINVRSRTIDEAAAARILDAADESFAAWHMIEIETVDLSIARDHVLRFDLGLRFPDAIHIVLAQRSASAFVSLDRRQITAARALGVDAINPAAD